MRLFSIGTVLCLFVLVSINSSSATNYYVDPATGAIGNDGSAGSPWNTLEAVMSAKTFNGGDTIFLKSGYHGGVSVAGTNSSNVVIKAVEGDNPLMKNIRFRTSKNWVLDGVTVSPEAVTPYAKESNLVYIDGGASFITVKNCSLYSVKDISGWDSTAWNSLPCGGFRIDGRKITVSNNMVMNFGFGLSTGYDSDSCLIEYNSFRTFSGDGMRGLGDYGVFQYNYVSNCVDVNENHDDAFQSWSYDGGVGKGVVMGMVLRGNHFQNFEDPDQYLRGPLQCIGLFDGMFEDWLIVNNLIVTDHYHGITLMGATNCKIINNTVLSIPEATVSPLWIQIANHKNGTKSTGNIVRNNLATDIDIVAGTTADPNIVDHNIGSALAKALVTNYNAYDFTPKAGHPYIVDAGTTYADIADVDINGNPRVYGSSVDLGCYEYSPTAVHPAGYRAPLQGAGNVSIAPQPVRGEGIVNITTTRAGMLGLALYGANGVRLDYTEFAVNSDGKHALRFDRTGLADGMVIYAVTFDGVVKGQGSVILAR